MGHEIPRHWRWQKERYSLIGIVCPNCEIKLFPRRDICANCGKPTGKKVSLAEKTEMPVSVTIYQAPLVSMISEPVEVSSFAK